MKKGKMAQNEQFHLSPQCFLCYGYLEILSLFTTQSQLLTALKKKPFENIVGKEENAGNQHFLPFPHVFYPSQKEFLLLRYIYFVVCKCFQFGPV